FFLPLHICARSLIWQAECTRTIKGLFSSLKNSTWGRVSPMRKQKGFSLIELLIVVAIILIIAAIAIPNLLRARMAANEASAVGSMRTINTSAVTYSSTWGVQYPTSQAVMGGATGVAATCALAQLIDPTLAAAVSAAT